MCHPALKPRFCYPIPYKHCLKRHKSSVKSCLKSKRFRLSKKTMGNKKRLVSWSTTLGKCALGKFKKGMNKKYLNPSPSCENVY